MKKSDLKEFIREEIIEILSEATPEDVETQKDLNKELEKTKELMADLGEGESDLAADINTIADEPISEDEDDEMDKQASAAAKKNDSVATVARKLADNAKEMKSVVNKWKKAEGGEKERLLARLKTLTKIKKELERLL